MSTALAILASIMAAAVVWTAGVALYAQYVGHVDATTAARERRQREEVAMAAWKETSARLRQLVEAPSRRSLVEKRRRLAAIAAQRRAVEAALRLAALREWQAEVFRPTVLEILQEIKAEQETEAEAETRVE